MFVSRICFDPDPPGGGGGAPAAPAAPPPASPSPAPTAPQTAVIGEPPPLPENAVIQIGDQFKTVHDLIQEAQRGAALSVEEVEAFKLFQQARAGDRGALIKVMGLDAAPEAPPQDPNVIIQSLQQQVEAMKAQLTEVSAPVSELARLREESNTRATIKEYAEKLPHLAHVISTNPNQASEITASINMLTQQALQANPGMARDVARTKATAEILIQAERQLEHIAKTFGAQWKPPTKAAAAPAPTGPNGQPVGNYVPSPNGPGAMPSLSSPAPSNTKFGMDAMKQQMRDRMAVQNPAQ